jgi:hypothetical protein
MKRDPRLHGLSSDHHHALVLAWRLRNQVNDPAAAVALLARARDTLERDLLPHFAVEESLLLPALRHTDESALADRTLDEHQALKAAFAAIDPRAPADGLRRFGELLQAHVRFEEAELFPTCERILDAAVLDRVAQAAPKITRTR